MNIPIQSILPNPEQPRRLFDETALDEMAQSIKENGIIQPVVVEDVGDGTYILHDGERRWRAAQLIGLTEIPAVIVPPLNGNGQEKRLVRALVANIQREDLGPIEEAQAYQRLMEMGWKVADVSRRTGKAAAIIYNRLKLLELEPEIQELIHTKRLSGDPRLCIALRKLPESQQRLEIARKAVERNLSIATVIKAVDVILARAEGKARKLLGIQAVDQATRIHGKEPDMPKWNAMAQAGLIPPWSAVARASEQVCKCCVLAISASDEICRECPAPLLLVQLMLTVEETR